MEVELEQFGMGLKALFYGLLTWLQDTPYPIFGFSLMSAVYGVLLVRIAFYVVRAVRTK